MPVAIRSLNGYCGFLDSLRSLEMTTVTEQIPVYRAVPYNTVGAVNDRPRAINDRPYNNSSIKRDLENDV